MSHLSSDNVPNDSVAKYADDGSNRVLNRLFHMMVKISPETGKGAS
jgi:hypothetical protein